MAYMVFVTLPLTPLTVICLLCPSLSGFPKEISKLLVKRAQGWVFLAPPRPKVQHLMSTKEWMVRCAIHQKPETLRPVLLT